MSFEEIFFKVSKLQRTLIVIAVSVLLLVGFFFFFVQDMLVEKKNRENNIKSLDSQIASQKAIQQMGPQYKKQIENLKNELAQEVRSLPDSQDIEGLLKRITDLLSESNLQSNRFVPGQEKKNEELYYATIPITLQVSGDYQKQGNFLTKLGSLPRIVNVPTIKLSKSGNLRGAQKDLASKMEVVTLDADISGETYRRLSQEESQAIAQKKAAASSPKAQPAGGAAKGKAGGN
jgi:type IV pilus assembly protein PilO